MPSIHHLAVIFCAAGMVASCQAERTPETAAAAFAQREGALVMLDCATDDVTRIHPEEIPKMQTQQENP